MAHDRDQTTPPRSRNAARYFAALTLALPLATGCTSWLGGDTPAQRTAFEPQDFVGDNAAAPIEPGPGTATTLIATDVENDPSVTQPTEPTSTTPTATAGNALVLNAMVGHINGEAVYADQVFTRDIEAQLRNFGQRFDDEDFRLQAGRVIQKFVNDNIIMSKLLLGEAERSLKDRQRQAIAAQVQLRREELLRFYGQGSVAKAKAEFRAKHDTELEDHLAQYGEELTIFSYQQSKVEPRIVVNERDIQRWYEENKERYEQPDTRVIRLLRTKSEAVAKQISQRLGKGEAIEKIAADASVNSYNAANAGLFNGGNGLAGDIVIGIKPVNDALIPLSEGAYAGPIAAGEHFYFVQAVEIRPGTKVPFADAQLEIRRLLTALQRDNEYLRFRRQVWDRGSFTDPNLMVQKLVEIASVRYNP